MHLTACLHRVSWDPFLSPDVPIVNYTYQVFMYDGRLHTPQSRVYAVAMQPEQPLQIPDLILQVQPLTWVGLPAFKAL